MKIHFVILVLFSIQEIRATSDNHFLTLSADCQFIDQSDVKVNLTLHTSEPFYGLLYSRDHPSTCRTVGDGKTATPLVINDAEKCGLKLMAKKQRNLLIASSDKVSKVFRK